VRSNNDSEIQFDGFIGADPAQLLFLKDTKQLGLHIQVHVADLIKEYCSVVSLLKTPIRCE
jgi:hypothetical protein